jgi:hypothetical protein
MKIRNHLLILVAVAGRVPKEAGSRTPRQKL